MGEVALPGERIDDLVTGYARRRSARKFLGEPLALDAFGAWLSHVKEDLQEAPVNLYVHLNGDRVAGVPGGLYRYEASHHHLVGVQSARHDRLAHAPPNRPIVEDAAFTLLWVDRADRAVTARERLIACGEVGQRLMDSAQAFQVGVCPLGGMDVSSLGFDDPTRVRHVWVGGVVEDAPLSLAQALHEEQSIRARVAAELEAPVAQDTSKADLQSVRPLSLSERSVTSTSLSSFLASRLPSYMVPTAWVFLNRLPLTANGKIDRTALAKIGAQTLSEAPTPGRSDVARGLRGDRRMERTIAELAAHELGFASIEVSANFFELGANSLQLVRLHRRLKETLVIDVSITHLFANPSVAALAVALGSNLGGHGQTQKEPVSDAQAVGRERARRRRGRRVRASADRKNEPS